MNHTLAVRPRTRFHLPEELSAPSPPEARGVPRDQVRLLVADRHHVKHSRFAQLDWFLRPGDLLVVNTSGTLPAAADGIRELPASPVVVHFSTRLDDGERVVELRTAPDAARPVLDAVPGERIRLGELPDSATLILVEPLPGQDGRNRLWRARTDGGLTPYLVRHGRPIRYGYVSGNWPLEAYQTVFATDPGSAEMPSAGRPFTPDLVGRLTSRGVRIAPVTLHTGVSSQEAGEPPLPERFRVPAATAELVNRTRQQGHRIVAVGTTVVRALESATGTDRLVVPAQGWTDLVIGPQRPPRVVDSLVTGLHAPDASHLLMLEAVAGHEVVRRAYQAALRGRYLWHEFGDISLLLADRPRP
ncbi:MAG TPA: S-adenosylmethionine:tRNA ribosyltransferase-isomerase [Micromonosporaceae bacterium]